MKQPTNYEEAREEFFRNRAQLEAQREKEWKGAWRILYIGIPAFILVVWLIAWLTA